MSTKLSVERDDSGGFVVRDEQRSRSVRITPGLMDGDFDVELLAGTHRVIKLHQESATDSVAILLGVGRLVQRFASEFLSSHSDGAKR